MLGGANDGYESTDARVASLAKAKKKSYLKAFLWMCSLELMLVAVLLKYELLSMTFKRVP
jgi:hypothetical protein